MDPISAFFVLLTPVVLARIFSEERIEDERRRRRREQELDERERVLREREDAAVDVPEEEGGSRCRPQTSGPELAVGAAFVVDELDDDPVDEDPFTI